MASFYAISLDRRLKHPAVIAIKQVCSKRRLSAMKLTLLCLSEHLRKFRSIWHPFIEQSYPSFFDDPYKYMKPTNDFCFSPLFWKDAQMTESVPVWSTEPSGSLWRNAGGWTLVILGVAGLILPVLPGIPLLIMGLVLLSADYRWARTCLRMVKLWTRKLNRHRSRLADANPIMKGQD